MNASNMLGPTVGGGTPPRHPGRVAGFFATSAADFIVWFVLVIGGMSGIQSSYVVVAVGVNLGYLIAGALVYYYGHKRGYDEFKQGVIIATSIVFLLSVTCWSAFRMS